VEKTVLYILSCTDSKFLTQCTEPSAVRVVNPVDDNQRADVPRLEN
jgi:hypothetical protein